MQDEKKTRRQQAEETKRHIFDVALRLLSERNFEDIKIRDIVNAAGVSVGSFYNYYTSKLDVYYETYYIADEYFETTVAPALSGSFEEKLFLYFDHYAVYSSEITSIALTKLLYNSENKCFDRPSSSGMIHVLRGIIQQGIDEGSLKPGPDDDCMSITLFFLISVRGLAYNWCTHNGSYDFRAAIRRYVARLLMAYTKA